jgi:hypothetical protein
LPAAFQVPIADSISREIKTIQELLGSWKKPLLSMWWDSAKV